MSHAMTVTTHVLIVRRLIVRHQRQDQDQTDQIAFLIITIRARAIIHVLHKTDLIMTDQELSVRRVHLTTDLPTIVRHVRRMTDRHVITAAAAEDVVNFLN